MLIRGARQIGKSSSIRNVANEFDNFIEINFDQEPQIGSIFEKNLDINRICNELSLITGKKIIEGKTLLFFDEIQLVPKAISSLRYFYETRPKLYVIVTGSLLDFALSDLPSFGLGRIQNVYMYPFSFFEFLIALDEEMLIDSIKTSSPTIFIIFA